MLLIYINMGKYDWIDVFVDDRTRVNIKSKYGFIDEANNEIISLKYDAVSSISEGFAVVFLKNKRGFIDVNEVLIPLQFDQAFPFRGGLALVQLGDKFNYIDKRGSCIKDY